MESFLPWINKIINDILKVHFVIEVPKPPPIVVDNPVIPHIPIHYIDIEPINLVNNINTTISTGKAYVKSKILPPPKPEIIPFLVLDTVLNNPDNPITPITPITPIAPIIPIPIAVTHVVPNPKGDSNPIFPKPKADRLPLSDPISFINLVPSNSAPLDQPLLEFLL